MSEKIDETSRKSGDINGENNLTSLVKTGGISNTIAVGEFTYGEIATFFGVLVVGVLILMTPLFRWNWFAIAAYIALSSLFFGKTPTGRPLVKNIYSILFKKSVKTAITDHTTINTVGNGIKTVLLDDPSIDAPVFEIYSNMHTVVYSVTTNINQWSTADDIVNQALKTKQLFNMFEGGEGIIIVRKADSDSSMLSLRDELIARESYEGDDLKRLSDKRNNLLQNVATLPQGRSVQQYVILTTKPKNLKKTLTILKRNNRIVRPATHPLDIILSTIGMEGGVENHGFIQEEE